MLASGSKLGPYEIQDLLGAGGMGEVYRAHDARIGREVAIKILPSVYSEEGTPQLILQSDVVSLDPRRPEYDVFPDGQRFLINARSNTGDEPINVIVNWPALQTHE